MEDYPFQTWKGYFDAFECSLGSIAVESKYPKYTQHLQKNEDHDLRVVAEMLAKGLSPTEGINEMMRAVVNGDRYAWDARETIKSMIGIFVQKHATPNFDKLFAPKRAGNSDLEYEACDNGSRGMLMDLFDEYGFGRFYEKYAPWSKIRGMYWEDIPLGIEFETARLIALKYTSTHLMLKYPH